MDFVKEFLSKEIVKSILFLAGVCIFLYLIRSILNLVLLTFLFAYLINSLENVVIDYLKKYIPIKKGIVTVIIYVCIIAGLIFTICNYLPIIINQSFSMIKQAEKSYMDITIKDIPKGLGRYLSPMIEKINVKNYTQSGVDVAVKIATTIGKGSVNVFMALILSLFFVMEKDRSGTNLVLPFLTASSAGFANDSILTYHCLERIGSIVLPHLSCVPTL